MKPFKKSKSCKKIFEEIVTTILPTYAIPNKQHNGNYRTITQYHESGMTENINKFTVSASYIRYLFILE